MTTCQIPPLRASLLHYHVSNECCRRGGGGNGGGKQDNENEIRERGDQNERS